MKKVWMISIVTLLFSSSMLAQSNTPQFYLGLGRGLNSTNSIGGLSFQPHKKVLFDAFTGLGFLGSKYRIGFVLNAKNKNTFCLPISLVYANGINDSDYDSPKNPFGDAKVKMDIKPTAMPSTGIQQAWLFREKNRLVFELGYNFLWIGL